MPGNILTLFVIYFSTSAEKKTLTCAFDKMLSCVSVFKLFLNKVCFVYIKGQRIKREASCEAGQLLLGDRNRRDGRMKSFFTVIVPESTETPTLKWADS